MGKLEFATHTGIMVVTSVINRKTCLLIEIEVDFVHYSMIPPVNSEDNLELLDYEQRLSHFYFCIFIDK